MKVLLALIEMALGIWLIASPWFVGYTTLTSQLIDVGLGLLILIIAGIYFLKNRKLKPAANVLPQLHTIILILGFVSVIEGVVGAIAFEYSIAAVVNKVITGILFVCVSAPATQIVSRKQVGISGEDGSELILLTKLEYKNESIMMKAKAFGTMPMIVKVEPAQLWLIIGYLSFDTIAHLPSILMTGRSQVKKEEANKSKKSN